jgi:prepilin-type N-terminal cleavage/methylation domain-containing protein
MIQRPGHRGFTLIEVLLAVALCLVLFPWMLWLYRYAGETRVHVIQNIQQVQSRRHLIERMTEHLRAAAPMTIAGFAMEGQPDSVSFIVPVLPPPAVYNEYGATEQAPPPQQDLVRITYRLRWVEDERSSGPPQVVGLEMGIQKLLRAQVVEEDPAEPVEGAVPVQWALLSPYFKFIHLRYFDGSQWLEQWTSPEPPRAVLIDLCERPLPEGVEPQDYPDEVVRRVVQIHAARRQRLWDGGGEEP